MSRFESEKEIQDSKSMFNKLLGADLEGKFLINSQKSIV